MEAVLLVGGLGTRLHPLTLTTPKPMLPVGGEPLVTHQLRRLQAAGVDHVVLATSYRADVFAASLGEGSELGVSLSYAVEDVPLGTGGAIRSAAGSLDGTGPVIVMNGDVLGDVDLGRLVRRHVEREATITIHVREVADPRAYGTVVTDRDSWVRGFHEKSADPPGRQINAGTYVLSRSALAAIPSSPEPVSLERTVFPRAIEEHGRVLGYRDDDSYWLDVGTPAAYVRANCDVVLGRLAAVGAAGRGAAASLLLEGADVAVSSRVSGGSVVGRRTRVGAGALIDSSVLMDDVEVGQGAVVRSSVVGRGAVVGPTVVLQDAVVADGAHVP